MGKIIKAVDLFCGAGGSSMGLLNACRSVRRRCQLLAVNHWNIAIESHIQNHPHARHLCQTLDAIDPRREVPEGKLDIMVASPECFVAGTLILCKRGLIPIEEVVVGDLVLTHRNRWRKVVSTMNSKRETVIVKGHGHYGLETTSEHPFYVRTRSRHWPKWNRNGEWRWSEPGWKPASDINGSFWGTPTSVPSIPLPIGQKSRSFWWMIGRWLGDGSLDTRPKKGGVITISCGKHEAAYLEKLLNKINGVSFKRRSVRTAVNFDCYDRMLANWIADHFGRLAHGKKLPSWVFGMKESSRRSLLDGYLSADGSEDARKWEGVSISKSLAIGLRLLAEGLGHRCALHKGKQNSNIIEGRVVNTRDLHKIAWVKNRKREWSKQIKKISWSRVSSVKETGLKKTVYNLSVREDESYVADGLIVHNCMHHSTALGGRPINDQSRATAWHVLRWAEALRIDNILIENVPEFRTWGPIGANGRPIKNRKGETYEAFLNALVSLGYNVEWRVLCAADYGDPTTRRRLFVMARKGNRKVAWPAQTHSEDGSDTIFGPTEKWVPAREIIDWQFPSQSIFGRKRPLADNTLNRIEAGIKKFWGPWAQPFLVMLYDMKNRKADDRYTRSVDGTLPTVTAQGGHIGLVQAAPFMVQVNHGKGEGGRLHSTGKPFPTVTGKNGMGLCLPFVLSPCGGGAPRGSDKPVPTITGSARGMGLCEPFVVPFFGERDGQEPRTHSLDKPMPAVTGHGAGGVVEPFIVGIAQTGGSGKRVRSIDKPLPTLCSKQEQCLVEPFIVKYYGTGGAKSVHEPIDTITGKARYGLVIPKAGVTYGLDILFRMFQPHELKKAMSMDDFVLVGTKTDQTKQIGNAVPVRTATALCRALIA